MVGRCEERKAILVGEYSKDLMNEKVVSLRDRTSQKGVVKA